MAAVWLHLSTEDPWEGLASAEAAVHSWERESEVCLRKGDVLLQEDDLRAGQVMRSPR